MLRREAAVPGNQAVAVFPRGRRSPLFSLAEGGRAASKRLSPACREAGRTAIKETVRGRGSRRPTVWIGSTIPRSHSGKRDRGAALSGCGKRNAATGAPARSLSVAWVKLCSSRCCSCSALCRWPTWWRRISRCAGAGLQAGVWILGDGAGHGVVHAHRRRWRDLCRAASGHVGRAAFRHGAAGRGHEPDQ